MSLRAGTERHTREYEAPYAAVRQDLRVGTRKTLEIHPQLCRTIPTLKYGTNRGALIGAPIADSFPYAEVRREEVPGGIRQLARFPELSPGNHLDEADAEHPWEGFLRGSTICRRR